MSLSIGGILLGLALLIVVALLLARPLIVWHEPQTASQSKRRLLEEQKDAQLQRIRTLEFDYETGKIPADVYEAQRAALVEQAAVTLQALDQLPAAAQEDARQQIEEAVARLRRGPVVAAGGQAGFCSHCGQPLDAGDLFCARCGQPVRLAQPVS